jgi:hypothetical protein
MVILVDEAEYRRLNPDRVRYYDVRTDQFRDFGKLDWERLGVSCNKYGVAGPNEHTQAELDRVLKALLTNHAVPTYVYRNEA